MRKTKGGTLTIHNEPDMQEVVQKLFELAAENYNATVKVTVTKKKKEKAI